MVQIYSDPDTTQRSPPDFDLQNFWQHFTDASKAVSHGASRISITCSAPPMPDNEECERLCADVEKWCLNLVSVFYSLPYHQGSLLVEECRQAVREIITGMLLLFAKVDNDQRLLQSLHFTGTVWEACDVVQTIPRDNRSVLLKKIKETQDLVKDALDEIQESLSDDSDGLLPGDELENRDTWSEADRQLIESCLGLVKAARGLLRRFLAGVQQFVILYSDKTTQTRGQLVERSYSACTLTDTVSHIKCMDELYRDYVAKASPCVDDLIAGLYAPLQRAAVRENAAALEELLRQSAQFSRPCILWDGSDVNWVDVLVRAVDHNMDSIKSMTSDCV